MNVISCLVGRGRESADSAILQQLAVLTLHSNSERTDKTSSLSALPVRNDTLLSSYIQSPTPEHLFLYKNIRITVDISSLHGKRYLRVLPSLGLLSTGCRGLLVNLDGARIVYPSFLRYVLEIQNQWCARKFFFRRLFEEWQPILCCWFKISQTQAPTHYPFISIIHAIIFGTFF